MAGESEFMAAARSPYNAEYFAWQQSVGEAGAILNQWKFRRWIDESHTVLDFGCGSGALLAALPGRVKIGVDVGREAQIAARSRGIEVAATLEAVPSESVDVVISNHALEHVERPLDELREIRRVLKPNGTAVLVVPVDDWRRQRSPDPADPNHHLYAWTPLLFANLLDAAGLTVESCRIATHAWRRKSLLLHRAAPPSLYRMSAWALAVLSRSRQIHAVARRQDALPFSSAAAIDPRRAQQAIDLSRPRRR